MTTPVTFELAKLLKEKGFDSATNTHYWLEDELNPEVVYSKTPRQGFFKEYGGSLLAPTTSEVVMWLYEKHDIWVVVNVDIQNRWYFELFNLKDKRNAEILTDDEYWFNSPTEAYEAAIEYTLNNLI